ncbi:MarR family winged helix-turn-helix transcriptional regulator [Marimonas lutisalis]|uniref:MarR family winged helix-turn-helix transcriptional regulator n=1 Tax=Marimonas lutisalis TaxID=2545756 RepID=UPI0013763EFB|nr:MarR family winged helix-turn-helix transcriptional regulator [Marimonas lutisalis]
MPHPQTQPDSDAHPAGPLPLHQFLTYRLSRVQAKLNAQATRLLRDTSGITLAQWRVIALIGAAGQTRLSALAREAALDKGLVSRNLKTLIGDGLVSTRTDDSDHRAQILQLTRTGQDIYERTLPIMQARQKRLRDGLSETELESFRRVLDHLEIAAEE